MATKIDQNDLLNQFKKENNSLKNDLKILRKKNRLLVTSPEIDSSSDTSASIEGLDTFLLRMGPKGNILYVNSAFTDHFSVNKDELIGKPVSVLIKVIPKELFEALKQPEPGEHKSIQIKSNNAKVYDIKNSFSNDVQDIVIKDVSKEHVLKNYISKYISSELTDLSQEDLKTFKHPERRLMSVSFTDLRGFTAMSEKLAPEEVRNTMNAYLEETIQAIDANGATVDKIVGDEVMAMYGAPRYYKDHSLRAIKTACEQMSNLKKLQKTFSQLGKTMPGCGIGINSGEMVVGNMGCSTRQDYTVLGTSVNLAARMCDAANEGEILITEDVMKNALVNMPENWNYIKLRSKKFIYDISLAKMSNKVFELPDKLKGKVFKIGPSVKKNMTIAEFEFQYLYLLKVKGSKEPLPVLSVRSKVKQSSLSFSEENVKTNDNERVFGKFRLQKLIGKGGMGEVWKAKDNFGNIVAIKMLLAGENASTESLKRFSREAEIMSKLQHRNICRINEVGEIDKITYISMEYIDGLSLSDLLKSTDAIPSSDKSYMDNSCDLHSVISAIQEKQNKTKSIDTSQNDIDLEFGEDNDKNEYEFDSSFTDEEDETIEDQSPATHDDKNYLILPRNKTLSIVSKIAEGLQHAHENGILHRDLKPANIMIREDGEPVVMDFGLAKMDLSTSEEGMSLSVSGQIVGTIEYMSPEQAQSSKHVDAQTDIYSLGAILFQMICGKRHFKSSGNILSDANKLKYYEPPKPSELNKHIDVELNTITIKSLRPDKNDRYLSIKELNEDLLHYEKGEVISARSVKRVELIWKWCKRNAVLSSTIVATFLIILFGTLLSFYNINLEKKVALKAKEIALQESTEATKAQAIAETNFNKLVQMAPGFITFAKKLISEYRFQEALDKINVAISLTPNMSEYWQLKGNMHQSLLELSEAQKAYKMVYKLNPENLENITSLEITTNIIESENNLKQLSNEARIIIFNCMEKQNRFPELIQFVNKLDNKNDNLIRVVRTQFKKENFSINSNSVSINSDDELMLRISGSSRAKNIDALKGLPFNRLLLIDTMINDLRPLKGMPLKALLLSKTKALDFSALKGMPLEHLNLTNNKMTELSMLKGMPLKELILNHCKDLNDISALKGLKLQCLEMQNTSVTDIQTLKDMPLEKLILASKIKNISSLKGSPLKYLTINCPVQDISALEGMPLEFLNLKTSLVTDISVLKGMPIQNLDIGLTRIQNITAIEGMPLIKLTLGDQVNNISALRGMPLTDLSIKVSKIKDISVLEGIPLKRLSMSGYNSELTDFSAIKGMTLEYFYLSLANVSDISFLEGTPIKKLALKTNTTDISVLKSMPLESLYLYSKSLSDISPLRNKNIKHLELGNVTQLKGDWVEVIKSLERLKQIRINGVQYNKDKFLEKYPK